MRAVVSVLVVLALTACAAGEQHPAQPSASGSGLSGALPTLAELDAAAPRAASGTMTTPERIIKLRGDRLVPFYPSRNATPDTDMTSPTGYTAALPGSTAELNYALYMVSNSTFTAGDTALEINVEAEFGGALDPADPQGLYLAFADHASGRWQFHKVDRLSRWMDINALNFKGRTGGLHSYLAVINHSGEAARLHNIYLRFRKDGDGELPLKLYYSQAVDPAAVDAADYASIRVADLGTGEHQNVIIGTHGFQGGIDPHVTLTPEGWRLRYTETSGPLGRSAISAPLEGPTGPSYIDPPATGWHRAAPSRPDGTVSMWLMQGSMGQYRVHLRNETTLDSGIISTEFFDVAEVIWDTRLGDPSQYSLLASMDSGTGHQINWFSRPGPTVGEVTPTSLYDETPTELDARYPAVLRLIDPVMTYAWYVFFSSLGRDGNTTYDSYAFSPGSFTGTNFDNVRRMINSSANDVLATAFSPDGTQMAYVLRPAGEQLGSLYLRRTFEAGATPELIAENVVGSVSFYDPNL